MSWLTDYAARAGESDRLPSDTRLQFLAAGAFGEAGSVLSEMKKHKRDAAAYPGYREALVEEVGDLLWYITRIATIIDPGLLETLPAHGPTGLTRPAPDAVPLTLAVKCGGVVSAIHEGGNVGRALQELWPELQHVAAICHMSLDEISERNIQKVRSRWPSEQDRVYGPHYDDDPRIPHEERLPRQLQIQFLQKGNPDRPYVLLRCNDLNFGDRLTDNIADPDGYRFHDCFHFAYAAVLGWSPVMRSLLRAKRKSIRELDENEDGARAVIIEEAVSATVFARGKDLLNYVGIDQVDYVLLKRIEEIVRGYEVHSRPLWQWEEAILLGFKTFRMLDGNKGGTVKIDMDRHTLDYVAPLRP